jgi:hypothetical protein
MVRSTKEFIIYVGDTESRFYHKVKAIIRLTSAGDKGVYAKGHPFSPCYTIWTLDTCLKYFRSEYSKGSILFSSKYLKLFIEAQLQTEFGVPLGVWDVVQHLLSADQSWI